VGHVPFGKLCPEWRVEALVESITLSIDNMDHTEGQNGVLVTIRVLGGDAMYSSGTLYFFSCSFDLSVPWPKK
jgi:hypothetical protein